MNIITTGNEERIRMRITELAKKGKAELLRKDKCFYVFYNCSPLNYYYDVEQAIQHYTRICEL